MTSEKVMPSAGTVVIMSQAVRPFLVGDPISTQLQGTPPPDITLTGNFGTTNYVFMLRWQASPTQPDQWVWGDGSTTSGNPDGTTQHVYTNVSGTAQVSAVGVTISATRYWVPVCGAQVVDTSQPVGSPGYFITNAPLGTYACTIDPGTSIPVPQTFTENSPPAPHIVEQIEAISG